MWLPVCKIPIYLHYAAAFLRDEGGKSLSSLILHLLLQVSALWEKNSLLGLSLQREALQQRAPLGTTTALMPPVMLRGATVTPEKKKILFFMTIVTVDQVKKYLFFFSDNSPCGLGVEVRKHSSMTKKTVLAKMSSFKQLDIAKTRGSGSASYVMGNPVDFIYAVASAFPWQYFKCLAQSVHSEHLIYVSLIR